MNLNEFLSLFFTNIQPEYVIQRQKKQSKVKTVKPKGKNIGISCFVGENGNTKNINLDDLTNTYNLLINEQFITITMFKNKVLNENKPCVCYLILALLIQLKLIIKVDSEIDTYESAIFKKKG